MSLVISCDTCASILGHLHNVVVPYKLDIAFDRMAHFCSAACLLTWAAFNNQKEECECQEK
jgi:hypothetical protein